MSSSVKVAEWPSFGKELLTRLTVRSDCNLFCNFSYFLFWFRGSNFGSDCAASWPLLIFTFNPRQNKACTLANALPFF